MFAVENSTCIFRGKIGMQQLFSANVSYFFFFPSQSHEQSIISFSSINKIKAMEEFFFFEAVRQCSFVLFFCSTEHRGFQRQNRFTIFINMDFWFSVSDFNFSQVNFSCCINTVKKQVYVLKTGSWFCIYLF